MVENEQSFGEYLRQLIKDSGITQHAKKPIKKSLLRETVW